MLNRHCTLDAHEIKVISPKQTFYVCASCLSDRQICLSNRMIIAQCKNFPNVIHTVNFNGRIVSPARTFKVNSNSFDPSADIHSKSLHTLQPFKKHAFAKVAPNRSWKRQLLAMSSRMAAQSSSIKHILRMRQISFSSPNSDQCQMAASVAEA